MKHALKVTTPTDLQIVMTREFDAPRKLVWDAMSKPDLLRRWIFCPPGWNMTRCDDDPRVGGTFHWEWSGPDGRPAMAMKGEYREVTPPERIVRTERFEMESCGGMIGEQVVTLALTESGGKTQLTLTLDYATKEARDGALASGMERGVGAGYDQLDALLAERV
ncbi:MAG: SRPBCC family protein [Phycisphaerales bacterium]|nr:SRPBCC family protein [Phycisphaerales bacterium]